MFDMIINKRAMIVFRNNSSEKNVQVIPNFNGKILQNC